MALTYGTIWGDPGDEKVAGTTKIHPYGTRMVIGGDRVFKYGGVSSAGAVGAGNIVQAPAGKAGHDMDLVVTSASEVAVGGKSIVVTTTADDAAEDYYADGYVYVNKGAGEGHVYKIRSHAAHDFSEEADLTLNFYDGDTYAEAITTSSEVGLVSSPYSNMVISTAGAHGARTGIVTGVCATEMAVSTFGWFQTWGLAAVLCDTTAFVVGNHVRTSDNQAGAVEPLDRDGTNENWEAIGVAGLIAPVDADYGVIDLRIAP